MCSSPDLNQHERWDVSIQSNLESGSFHDPGRVWGTLEHWPAAVLCSRGKKVHVVASELRVKNRDGESSVISDCCCCR